MGTNMVVTHITAYTVTFFQGFSASVSESMVPQKWAFSWVLYGWRGSIRTVQCISHLSLQPRFTAKLTRIFEFAFSVAFSEWKKCQDCPRMSVQLLSPTRILVCHTEVKILAIC